MALIDLPVSTFASIADAGWQIRVYCPSCHCWKRIEVTGTPRPRLPFHAPSRCKTVRPVTRTICESLGHVQIEPPVARPRRPQMCRVDCAHDLPPWGIEGILPGEPPWPSITNQDRFRCPVCRREAGPGFYGAAHTPDVTGFHHGHE